MSKKVLAAFFALTLSMSAAGVSFAGECTGTVTAAEGGALTVKCDDATEPKATGAIKVGDKVTVKAVEKSTEKAVDKAVGKVTEKPHTAPAAKKKLEGC